MEGRHYNSQYGGYTQWIYRGSTINRYDNSDKYEVLCLVDGAKIYETAKSLEQAKDFIDFLLGWQ